MFTVGPSLYKADGRFIVLCNHRKGWVPRTILRNQHELNIIAYGIVDVSPYRKKQRRVDLIYFKNSDDCSCTFCLYDPEDDCFKSYDCDWRYATNEEIAILKNMVLNNKITLTSHNREETLKYCEMNIKL